MDTIIAVDIGTSYTKSTTYGSNGEAIYSDIRPSHKFEPAEIFSTQFAEKTFQNIQNALKEHVIHSQKNNNQICILSISAISPVLVCVSASDPSTTLSLPYWRIPELDGVLVGEEYAQNRIQQISDHYKSDIGGAYHCTDLIGYLNFRLSGSLYLNQITLMELGGKVGTDYSPLIPDITPPGHFCKISNGSILNELNAKLVVGAPDSFTSALSVGAIECGDQMIYLGTFGSLLNVTGLLSDAVTKECHNLPYEWVFSAPKFAVKIEEVQKKMLRLSSVNELDMLALDSNPGADGVFFALPKYGKLEHVQGKFELVNNGNNPELAKPKIARAVLESIAHAIVASGHLKVRCKDRVFLSGGGSQSSVWRQIIADCTMRKVSTSEGASSALGAAKIGAQSMEWIDGLNFRKTNHLVSNPVFQNYQLAQQTTRLASAWYERVGEAN